VASSGRFLSYQWQKNGTNISGETNSSLVITDANATLHEGNYSVVVSNDFGSVQSSFAQLSVPNPVALMSAISGAGTTGATGAWQQIEKNSPFTNHIITSVDLYLRANGGPVTLHLEVYDQVHMSHVTPNNRFYNKTPVATSNSKTISNSSIEVVNFTFPSGTSLSANPPYYIWLKASSGSAVIQFSSSGSSTTGATGNIAGTLNHKVYGIAP
jgi:hypothetical protein